MADTELTYKIALSLINGLHADNGTELLERVGTPQRYFEMSPTDLRRQAHLSEKLCDAAMRAGLLEKARSEEEFVLSHRIRTYFFTDPDYPKLLRECPDAPAMLYVLGDADLDNPRPVSIVGTRHNTPYGDNFNTRFVRELAELVDGLSIISGLAYGTDICAHRSAMRSHVPTVAVLANALDTIYPAEHRADAVKIIQEGGAIVSETPRCVSVRRRSFLQRNRIIAGLSKATIVVESGCSGGSMTTARLAYEYNRDVFAVPGRAFDMYSRGTNAIIDAQKATLLQSAEDFVLAMRWPVKKIEGTQQELPIELDTQQKRILELIEANPIINVNELCRAMTMSYAELTDTVFRMEMRGLINSLPGGIFSINR